MYKIPNWWKRFQKQLTKAKQRVERMKKQRKLEQIREVK